MSWLFHYLIYTIIPSSLAFFLILRKLLKYCQFSSQVINMMSAIIVQYLFFYPFLKFHPFEGGFSDAAAILQLFQTIYIYRYILVKVLLKSAFLNG